LSKVPPKPPEGYDLLKTHDGSYTFFSRRYNEACHSKDGAVAETYYNFIEGCQIEKYIFQDHLCIFEVGLGLGLGYQESVKFLKSKNYQGHCLFISTEIDINLAKWCGERDSFPELIEKKLGPLNYLHGKEEHFEIIILLGDARKSIPQVFQKLKLPKFDAIYQDAFGPTKNPALWTRQWFTDLASQTKPQAILSTYCSSTKARLALREAGFGLYPRKGFSHKRDATYALYSDPGDKALMSKLARSKVSAFCDNSLS